MAMLTGAKLRAAAAHYYEKSNEYHEKALGGNHSCEATHRVPQEGKLGQYRFEKEARRYEDIGDTLMAADTVPALQDEVTVFRVMLSTVGNRVRLVRDCLDAKGEKKALDMAMELLELIEEQAEFRGRLDPIELGEAKVRGDA